MADRPAQPPPTVSIEEPCASAARRRRNVPVHQRRPAAVTSGRCHAPPVPAPISHRLDRSTDSCSDGSAVTRRHTAFSVKVLLIAGRMLSVPLTAAHRRGRATISCPPAALISSATKRHRVQFPAHKHVVELRAAVLSGSAKPHRPDADPGALPSQIFAVMRRSGDPPCQLENSPDWRSGCCSACTFSPHPSPP